MKHYEEEEEESYNSSPRQQRYSRQRYQHPPPQYQHPPPQPQTDFFAYLAQQEKLKLDREIAEKKEKRKRKEAKERLRMEQEIKQQELIQKQQQELEFKLQELRQKQEQELLKLKEKKKARKQKKKEAKYAKKAAVEQKQALQASQIAHKQKLINQEDASRTHSVRGRSLHRSPPRQSVQAEKQTLEYYDQTNPDEVFPLKVRELAKHKFPEIFAKHADDDKFQWTWSTQEDKPIYVTPNAQARTLFSKRVVRTPAVKRVYNKVRAPVYDVGDAKDVHYINHTSVAPALKVINEKLKEEEEEKEEDSTPPAEHVIHDLKSARAQRKDIIQGIRAVDSVTRIKLDPDFPLSGQAINKEAFEKYFPKDKSLEVLSDKRTHFDGVLTTWNVSIDRHVPSKEAFIQALLAYYNSEMSVFIDRDNDETPPEIVTIHAFYNTMLEDRKLAERMLPIWQGLTSQKPDLTRIYYDMREILDDIGSDSKENFENYTLNLNKFRISMLDLIRTGAGRKAFALQGCQPIEGGAFIVGFRDLGWAVVHGVKPLKDNDKNCFAQALNYFQKQVGWRTPHQHYTSLYKEVSHVDFEKDKPVSEETAAKVANLLGLHCEIYRRSGMLRHSSHATIPPIKPLPPNHDRTLRLLLDADHFVNIVEMREQVTQPSTIKSKARMPYRMPKLITYYDLETIIEKNGDTMPYSNAYCTNLKIDEEVLAEDVKVSIVNKPSLEIFREMYDEIVSAGPGYSHHLIAYNGSRFDHLLLYLYMLRTGMAVVEGANPKGKGQSFRVAIKCPTPLSVRKALAEEHLQMWLENNPNTTKKRVEKVSDRIRLVINAEKSYITVWDPVLFIRNSLKNAAASFKTEALKTGFDHDEVQEAYASGNFDNWLETNKDALIDYNINDVVVLSQVTQQMFKALEHATGMSADTILSKPSISNLAYSFWKKEAPFITTEGGKKRKVSTFFKPAATEAYDKLIRASLIAGRTECIPGHHIFKKGAIMVDVVSLYPTMMKDSIFPSGMEKILMMDDEDLTMEYFEDGVPGLYYVRWDQANLKDAYGNKAKHPILPTRRDTLDWKSFGSGEGLLPDVTIRQLLQYGAEVVFSKPPETVVRHKIVIDKNVALTKINKKTAEAEVDKGDAQAEIDKMLKELIAKHGNAELVEGEKFPEIVWDVKESIRAIVWPETFKTLPRSEDGSENAPAPFAWYVTQLKDQKNQQDVWKEESDERYNPALREMIKMLLNAMSGKVIQRNYEGKYKLVNTKDEICNIADEMLGHSAVSADDMRVLKEDYKFVVDYLMTSVDGTQYGNVSWEKDSFGTNSKPSHLGVFIYAYARAYMYDNLYSRCKVFYSDTDSALIELDDYENIPDELKFAAIVPIDGKGKEHPSNYKISVTGEKDFGMLEIETEKGGVFVFKEAYLVSPKTYALLANGEVVKDRYKGIRTEDKFELNGKLVKINEKSKEFFEMLWANGVADKETVVHTWNFSGKWGKNLGLRKNFIEKKIKPYNAN